MNIYLHKAPLVPKAPLVTINEYLFAQGTFGAD
jgi:hypothetical protein